MTRDEIRVRYFDIDGYITCSGCPLEDLSSEDCEHYGSNIKGYDDCVEAIYNYLNKFEPTEPTEPTESTEDIITKPSHYNRKGAMECLDEIELIFGREALKYFCLCNAWKYRYRAADKNGEEDIKKSDEYLRRYKEMCEDDRNSRRPTSNLFPIGLNPTGETTTTGAVI